MKEVHSPPPPPAISPGGREENESFWQEEAERRLHSKERGRGEEESASSGCREEPRRGSKDHSRRAGRLSWTASSEAQREGVESLLACVSFTLYGAREGREGKIAARLSQIRTRKDLNCKGRKSFSLESRFFLWSLCHCLL